MISKVKGDAMGQVDLRNLKVKVSPWYKFRFRIRMAFQKMEYAVPVLAKVLRYVGYRIVLFGNLGQEEKGRLDSIKLLSKDDVKAQDFGSQYGYSDEVHELLIAYKYWQQVRKPNFETMPAESSVLYHHTTKFLSELLTKDQKIDQFFNFGVCYAYIDAILAEKFPKVTFLGIDRSKYTKMFNEDNFGHIKNMEFIAGDIFEYFKDKNFNGGVFFTARTLVYLPMNFIERLFDAVKKAGFRYIVGMEQIGISHETMQVYDFSYDKKSSVLFRNNFFIHNYPGLVCGAGYDLKQAELIGTNHPHADYRFLSFLAENNIKEKKPGATLCSKEKVTC